MIKSIIFDFDGTLTPLTLNFTALREEIVIIAQKYVTEEAIGELEGHYIIEMIYEIGERLKGEAVGEESFEEEAFEKLRVLELEAAQGKELYSYSREVLKDLKDRGIKTGIITRTCIDVIRSVFPDVEQYMDAVVTRENIRQVKPHPAHALEALRMLDVLPEEAILAGDHPTDVIAGKEAGMITAGVLAGRTGRKAFEDVGATFILDDIRDLRQLLLKSEIIISKS
jgi:phosphoglycolate phosphatase